MRAWIEPPVWPDRSRVEKHGRTLVAVVALLLCGLLAVPRAAVAATSRVGVLTVTYAMNAASGSGQGDLEGTATDAYGDSWPMGATEADSLSLSITGQAEFEVLETETNFIIGSPLTSSAQQTASGSDTENWWGWGNSPSDPANANSTVNRTFVTDPDPTDLGTNFCVIITNLPDNSGQFHGICRKAVYGEVFNGIFYRENDPWMDDVSAWTGDTSLWISGSGLEGVECTLKAQDDARHFQFALPSSPDQWSQTITAFTPANNSYTYAGDGTVSESGSATGGNTVTLSFVPDQFTVNYTATPTNGGAPLDVRFIADMHDSVGYSIESYHWDFGDGTTSDAEGWRGLDHTYSEPGDYTISLVCSNTLNKPVSAIGPALIRVMQPAIAFTASPAAGRAPLTVAFSCPGADNTGSSIEQWYWDFGDETTSQAQNPTHTFTNSGDYTVSLIVVNASDHEIDATGPSNIEVSPPTVQFTASPQEGAVPLFVQFTCPDTDSAGNFITDYSWSFGDGSAESASRNPPHVYLQPGRYIPDLAATNASGDEVDGSGPGIIVADYLGLVLNGDFETGDFYGWTNGGLMNYSAVSSQQAAVSSGVCGAQLQGMFGTLSTLSQTLATTPGGAYLLSFWLNNPPGNSVNQFLVSWGGNTVWGVTNLAASGWTNVQITVTASVTNTVLQFGFEPMSFFGLDDVAVESAFVQVSASPTAGAAPLQVSFTSPPKDNNNQTIAAWAWDFGDGTAGAGQNPAHTYLAGGRFLPVLIATNSSGGTVIGVAPAITVTVPTLQFAASANVGVAPLNVLFTCPATDSGGHSINAWNWNFGDGASSAAQHPTHTYTAIGQFSPTLTVTNNQGVAMAASGPAITVIQPTGLVINGGFETGDFTGWTGSGNFDCFVSTYFVHSGHWSAELVPSGSMGYLSQTLPTTPGASYVLSFWLDSPDGQTPNEFSVSWNGTTLFHQTNLPALGWTNMQFAVTANAAGTPLQFGFRDDYSYLALDDIRVISPAIQFTASPTNGLLPLTVHFHCPPVDSASNAIASWRWSFGDGSTSPWEDPVHTYTNAGNFLPACIVTNSAGLAIAASGPAICVQPPPTVHFTASPLIGAAPLPVQFTCPALDSNGNAISAWRWDFGDGSTSTAQNPLHTYANPGMFSPALVATNSNQARVAASGPTIAVASRSGLVTNGDFETGNFFAWTSGGATSYASVSSASQFVHSGNYGAELAGTYGFVNTLSQNLATTPGANYLLSFWLNNPAGNSPNQLLVSWGGNTVWGVTNLNATGWTNVQLSVTAGATSSALQFVFEPVLYFGLDDVSVAPATPPRPGIASMAFSPASSSVNLILSGTNGQSGATYCILMTTNLANLLSQWTPVATNALATGGNFTLTATNAFDPRAPQRFYILQAR